MDFPKPQNNSSVSRKMMMLMKGKSTQKSVKYEDDDLGSDDNLGGEEEETGIMEKNDVEEKKQKRGVSGRRVGGGSANSVNCQAEKCTADLIEAKRYHRRHKVCELHAKAPCVLVSGLRQRFCQQCSRFHELSEFDEAKRSCRRRLAGHNERRRKNSELQGEGGSSRSKAPSPQCRPTDNESGSRVQMSSYAATNPTTYNQYQIR